MTMKTLKIGIMPVSEFQKYTIDIAKGIYKPKRSDPKIWFSSIESFNQVLSSNNQYLLKLILENEPQSIKELSELSGRQTSNLSRTLRTLERYGIIELKKTTGTIKKPIVKAADFDLQLRLRYEKNDHLENKVA